MITIIDYGLGNLASVANALKNLEIPHKISSSSDVVMNAKALILPGVGGAGQGMENLKKQGMDQIIIEQAKKGIPLLGICLGMQLLLSSSQEGNVKCLDIIKGTVKKISTKEKLPQIGWNQVQIQSSTDKMQNHKVKNVFNKIKNNSYFYFIHSYICQTDDKEIVIGKTIYGEKFCSAFQKENIFGVQFHPEKSGEIGLKLLKNFWEAVC